VVDRDDVDWSASEEDAEGRWRRRIKYDLLVQKMEKTPLPEAQDKLLRRYRSFAKRIQKMTADELLETYLTSLTASLDPHTTYMSPGTLDSPRMICSSGVSPAPSRRSFSWMLRAFSVIVRPILSVVARAERGQGP